MARCFQTVFMSPLTVSVPQLLTMEPIVLFGGGEENVGILFRSFLEVSCSTWWGISTSCSRRQACSLCPFPGLSASVSPLCATL